MLPARGLGKLTVSVVWSVITTNNDMLNIRKSFYWESVDSRVRVCFNLALI